MPLIVLEGIDGCGKSTQHQRLIDRLAQAGYQAEVLREPGGTVLGERIRELLLDPSTEACPEAELFAYQVARAQLVRQHLKPLLAAGRWVVLDRFWYSTVAYQAFGLGLNHDQVRAAIDLAIGDVCADVAVYLRIAVSRAQQRRQHAADDRIEARGQAYLEAVRAGYEHLVTQGELIAVDADQEPDRVAAAVWAHVAELIQARSSSS